MTVAVLLLVDDDFMVFGGDYRGRWFLAFITYQSFQRLFTPLLERKAFNGIPYGAGDQGSDSFLGKCKLANVSRGARVYREKSISTPLPEEKGEVAYIICIIEGRRCWWFPVSKSGGGGGGHARRCGKAPEGAADRSFAKNTINAYFCNTSGRRPYMRGGIPISIVLSDGRKVYPFSG